MKTYPVKKEICEAMLKVAKNWNSFASFCHEVKIPATSLRRILSGKNACARNWRNIVYYYNRRILNKNIKESLREI